MRRARCSGRLQRRELTFFDAAMYVMGGILGVGLFYNPARIAALVPHTGWFLALWVLGGTIALAGAMTSAELGGSFPRAGGWYVFLEAAWGRFVAFLYAFVVLGVITTGACAVIAGICVDNVRALFPAIGEVGGKVLGAALLGGVAAFAMLGAKAGAWLSNACMLLKLGALAALVIGALVFWSPDAAPVAVERAAAKEITLGALGAALLPVFFACGGWQQVCFLASEVRDASRTVPRAIVVGVIGVVIVYVLVNFAYVHVLGIEGLAGNTMFARDVAERVLGPLGGKLVTAAIAVSALGITVVLIVTTPWMFVAMAREGLFFRRFAYVDPRSGAPVPALAALGAMCVFWWLQGSAGELVDAAVFAEWVFHALIALALLRLRRVARELPRPFKSPLYPLAPLAYLAIALVVVLTNVANPESTANTRTSLVVLAIGALAYRPWRWLVARASSSTTTEGRA